jgi:hypothetical protein
MSLSNITSDNPYDLFCQTITVDGVLIDPSGFTGNTGATGPVGATGATGPAGAPPLYIPAAATWYMGSLSQAIPDGTETAIKFDAFSNTSPFTSPPVGYNSTNGMFTANHDCIYNAAFQAGFNSSGSNGNRQIYIKYNGGNNGFLDNTAGTSASGFVNSCWTGALNVGDTLQVFVFQNSGGPKTLTNFNENSNNYTKISMSFMYSVI